MKTQTTNQKKYIFELDKITVDNIKKNYDIPLTKVVRYFLNELNEKSVQTN